MEQNHLPMSHDPLLVGFSFLIAIFAAYSALTTVHRLRYTRAGKGWLWLGATAFGLGAWAMQLTAMTALKLGMLVAYDPLLTLLSAFFAIAGAAMAFQMVSKPQVGLVQLLGAGFFLGAGIGTMHYTGMFSMRLDAQMEFNPVLVALSVLVAVALGTLGLWILTSPVFRSLPFRHLFTATLTGLAIPFMHYTGMLAVRFTETGHQIHSIIVGSSLLLSVNPFPVLALTSMGLPLFLSALIETPDDSLPEVQL